jgi:hypothetical protein
MRAERGRTELKKRPVTWEQLGSLSIHIGNKRAVSRLARQAGAYPWLTFCGVRGIVLLVRLCHDLVLRQARLGAMPPERQATPEVVG